MNNFAWSVHIQHWIERFYKNSKIYFRKFKVKLLICCPESLQMICQNMKFHCGHLLLKPKEFFTKKIDWKITLQRFPLKFSDEKSGHFFLCVGWDNDSGLVAYNTAISEDGGPRRTKVIQLIPSQLWSAIDFEAFFAKPFLEVI